MSTGSATSPAFNADPIDVWGEPSAFVVERDHLIRYAQATNDDLPAHAAGDVASPIFAAVPAMKVCDPIVQRMIPDEVRMSGLHGEQDFRYHRPIVPGMTLVSRARGVGFRPVGAGVTVTVKGETTTPEGDLVCEQWVTVIMRGAKTAAGAGGDRPDHKVDPAVKAAAPIATFSRSFDPDTTRRYAHASGDFMPIHTDDEFARAVHFPGIILHGLCTLAFATRGLVRETCGEDSTRLRRLAVRFSRIVLPAETITTRVWAAGEQDGRSVYAFDTAVDDGSICLKDGLIEVAP